MSVRTIQKGKALYDYTGNEQLRQLSFKAGDIINITNQYDNGWWAGELNGKVGYLPATYIQIVAGAAPSPQQQPQQPQPQQSTPNKTTAQQTPAQAQPPSQSSVAGRAGVLNSGASFTAGYFVPFSLHINF